MKMASSALDVDNGYAWIILFVSFTTEIVAHLGTPGIFYMAILEKYQQGMFF